MVTQSWWECWRELRQLIWSGVGSFVQPLQNFRDRQDALCSRITLFQVCSLQLLGKLFQAEDEKVKASEEQLGWPASDC